MLKSSDNPPSLPTGIETVRDLAARWSVVQTVSRAEKALAWALRALSAGYFLPMTTRVMFSGGRKRTGQYPLFSGYLFVNSDAEWWRVSAASRHVARIIPVKEQSALVTELAALEQALTLNPAAVLYPGIVAGRRYRVLAGPLGGLVGTAVEFQGATHVVLSVSLLGQGAALPIDASLLEAVDD